MICGCFPSLFFLQPGNVPITSSIFLKPQTFLQIVRLIFFDFYPLFFSPQITRLLHTTNLKGKMHCLSRQCILKVAAGCHFTDPIALRLSLSTETPLNLFFVLYRMLFIKDVYYKYFIIVGTRMFISTGFAT